MKFTNHSKTAVRVAGYGWAAPGESLDIKEDDAQTISSIEGLSFFKDPGGSSKPKTAKKKPANGK